MMGPAASSVARSAIAGRLLLGVRSGSAGQLGRHQWFATSASSSSWFRATPTAARRSQLRPVHRPGRLRLEQRPGLRQGRRRGDRKSLRAPLHRHQRDLRLGNDTRWGAVVGVGLEYGFTPNWSFGVEYNHLFMGERTLNFTNAAGVLSTVDRDQPGRRCGHRPHQLQVRRPGRRALLINIDPEQAQSPGPRPGLFAFVSLAGRYPAPADYRRWATPRDFRTSHRCNPTQEMS